ncbi:anti-sigma factor family protein [Azospirillum halopraeferens]|uniref:anti-sigma factor family protein n=1 Tax=Azospirillum halopraeferens TaxID=34010 RepID=UPI0004919150|nr:anti-sigma factor [Azospirillum halopraeferens]
MDAHRVKDEELHAYVDGRLDGDRRLAVERWLAEDAEAARRVEDYRAQAALLHEMFDSVLREEPPRGVNDLTQQLKGRFAGNDNVPTWHARPLVRVAAAVMLLVVGAAGGYLGHGAMVPVEVAKAPAPAPDRPTLQTFAAEAAKAHRFYTADERFQVEMGAEDQGALDSWLSHRVGRSIFGPDLSGAGYRLIGGRSLPTETGPGAQYMYRNDQSKRITLFVGQPPAGQEASFSFAQNGDVATFYWVEGGLAYALIGRLSKDELLGITKAVYEDVKAGRKPRQPAPQPQAQQPVQQPAEQPQPQMQHQEQNPVQPVSDTLKPKDS